MILAAVFLRSFARNDRGSTALLCGLSFLVLCLTMALAYDSSRLNNISSRVQAALDAAALAGAKTLDEEGATDSEVIAVTTKFFDAHRSSVRINGLQLGQLATTINRQSSTVEVGIDGSISSLFGTLAKIKPRLEFSQTSETTYKTRKIELSLVLDITGSMTANGKITSLKTAAKDLVDTLFATNPNQNAIRVALVPYAASVNAGSYANAVAGYAYFAPDSCVVERASATTTDEPPGSGRQLGRSNIASNPNYSCPTAPVEPLTDLWSSAKRDAFKSRIDAMTPNGGTAGHTGLAWGWYFLSQQWASLWPSDRRPRAASADVVKAIILMTDGEFNTSYLESNMNSTDPNASGSSANQALALCGEIKKDAANIAIYTVGFQAPAAAEAMLRTCSGDENYFDANSAGDLISAFRQIAERLNNLRVSS